MATRRWYGSRTGHSAARIVTGVGAVFALFEVVYILLILFNANPLNGFFRFVQSVAEPLALFFPGLFNLVNDKLEIILNYGLAAIFWLVVTGFIARLID